MITFKIQGAKYKLPTAWADVTYQQHTALLSLPNTLIDQINLFTGIGLEKLQKSELKNLEKIALALSFINIPPDFTPGPKDIGKYLVPKDVTIESLGQFEDLRGLCNKRPANIDTTENRVLFCELCLEAAAIYVQKIKDGVYNSNNVPQVKDELRDECCLDIIQTGSFFLFKPLHSSMNMRDRFRMVIQRLRKLLQDLPGYQKSLDFLQHSSKPGKE